MGQVPEGLTLGGRGSPGKEEVLIYPEIVKVGSSAEGCSEPSP